MTKAYPTAERVRELFSVEDGKLIYQHAPYKKPHLLGREAGHVDTRDGIGYVNVDRKPFVRAHIITVHLTGEPPLVSRHHLQLTHARLTEALRYEPETGAFYRTAPGKGVQVGTRADYVEHNGYRAVKLDGTRYQCARLAWFYVNGDWPERVLRFQDGNEQNCAIANLAFGEWVTSTPEGKRAYDKSHRQRKPEWHRKANLKRDFGITIEQYEDALVSQGGVCAICARHEVEERSGKRKQLAVDHDHSDGTMRGLLCGACNNGLGRFEDDVTRLRAAIAYLEVHAAKPKTNVIPLSGRRISGAKGN